MEIKNISLYRLSKMTGISDSQLGKILNGITTNPRINTVKAIAKALDVSINEIVWYYIYGKELMVKNCESFYN